MKRSEILRGAGHVRAPPGRGRHPGRRHLPPTGSARPRSMRGRRSTLTWGVSELRRLQQLEDESSRLSGRHRRGGRIPWARRGDRLNGQITQSRAGATNSLLHHILADRGAIRGRISFVSRCYRSRCPWSSARGPRQRWSASRRIAAGGSPSPSLHADRRCGERQRVRAIVTLPPEVVDPILATGLGGGAPIRSSRISVG
jgi:hypothetical protein